jgi:hypothetical protein
VCAICQKALCRSCVGRDTPRLVCTTCLTRASAPVWGWSGGSYGVSWEYRSPIVIAGWPLVHLCFGSDPVTLRPRVARGIVAIGNAAVGVLAIGGAALGAGLSIGGLAVGTVAIGGAAIGFAYAIGGGAVAPAVIDGRCCDQAALDFLRQWITTLPPACR